ncbi:Bug family tripartite tricarboxylate transporter substrate binding protein [Lacisediminimonas profundi]|uniref:Bug family tripartite tricarboxylate transporter substrate binding protein n=1 Tax=Lacisediminimonas profundi TaxID=2603856 RepID=UPI00124B94B3|nr:tripartite tricarboxylate transporter substrate binding protein [Lacisediminimonas profundi]
MKHLAGVRAALKLIRSIPGTARLAALTLAVVAGPALAQYPTKPITIIVPGPPGGSGDIVTRTIAKELSEVLRQPVVVDNRAGASGVIGAQAMLRAAPDGYTLMMGNTGVIGINFGLLKNLPYKPQDFTAITDVLLFPNVLAVRSDSPIKSVAGLIAAAKASPGKLSYSSSGIGQTTHLSGELFRQATGIHILHVPYKGANLGLQAVMSGEVDFMFDNFPSIQGQISGQRLRALAVTGKSRSPRLPDVPTMSEAGVPDFHITGWFGLVGPAGMPVDIRDKLQQTIAAILKRPDVQERFQQQGGSTGGTTPSQFDAFIQSEIKKWGAAVKGAGVTVDQ